MGTYAIYTHMENQMWENDLEFFITIIQTSSYLQINHSHFSAWIVILEQHKHITITSQTTTWQIYHEKGWWNPSIFVWEKKQEGHEQWVGRKKKDVPKLSDIKQG